MLPRSRYQEHRVPLAPSMSLSVFSDGVLEVLSQSTLDESSSTAGVVRKTECHHRAGKTGVDHLDGLSALPDDVAMLIIQRGGNHGNRTSA